MTQPESQQPKHRGGLLTAIQDRCWLIVRLMLDWRINIFLKLIPIAGIVYVISPFDFPGPLDDIVVLLFSLFLFVELCPPKIVQQHLDHIRGVNTDIPPSTHQSDDIIDAEFKILDDTNEKKTG